jgi:hypothetical protein
MFDDAVNKRLSLLQAVLSMFHNLDKSERALG